MRGGFPSSAACHAEASSCSRVAARQPIDVAQGIFADSAAFVQKNET
jgi:hypothetical protein